MLCGRRAPAECGHETHARIRRFGLIVPRRGRDDCAFSGQTDRLSQRSQRCAGWHGSRRLSPARWRQQQGREQDSDEVAEGPWDSFLTESWLEGPG